MVNGNARSGSTFSSGAWQPSNNIWGNPAPSYGRRDAATPRGKSPIRTPGPHHFLPPSHLTQTTESDEASPAVPSGSGALAASSEAEPWVNRNGGGGHWNTSEQPAHNDNSGSGSPNRPQTAGQGMHDFSNPPFRSALPTIGQGGNMTRDRSGQPPPGYGGHYATGHDGGVDNRDSGGSIGSHQYGIDAGVRTFPSERRGLPEGFSDQVTGTSRDADVAPSTLPEHAPPQGLFGGNTIGRRAFGEQGQGNGHSHHASMQSSTSYRSQTANQRAYNMNTQLDDDRFARVLSLEDSSDPARNGLAAGSAYATAASQSFQFNPVSQPWEAGPANSARGSANGYAPDGYMETLPAPYQTLSSRSSVVDRVPTPAGSYHQMNSPRAFGTPPARGTSFSRPGSRDPRSEADRRGHGQQPFPHHPHPTTLGYYNQPYPGGDFSAQHVYPPYAHHLALRGVPMPPFAAMGAYGPGHGAPPPNGQQAARDQGAEGMRSEVLEEFRNSNRSNRRYELKVGLDVPPGGTTSWSVTDGFSPLGHRRARCRVQRRSARLQVHPAEARDSQQRRQGPLVCRDRNQRDPAHEGRLRQLRYSEVLRARQSGAEKDTCRHDEAQSRGAFDANVRLPGGPEGEADGGCSLHPPPPGVRPANGGENPQALEHVLVEQQAELARELEADPLTIIKDSNGNHVIQRIIVSVPEQYTTFITDAFRGEVATLAKHQYGCRVLQRMLEYGSEAGKAVILEELHQNAQQLMVDQYGNYVVQHVIQSGSPRDRSRLIKAVLQNLVFHIRHKYTSNVVEKCIEWGTLEDRQEIRRRVSRDGNELRDLIVDQYGNYVVRELAREAAGQGRGQESEG